MASLYHLTREFLDIANQLEEMELDAETIANTLESLEVPIEEKAENIIKFAKNLEAMAEARKNEAKRLNELATKDLKKSERLLSYLDDTLKLLGKKQLTAGVFEVKYKKGLEVVEIVESEIPDFIIDAEKGQIDLKVEQVVIKVMGKPDLKRLVKEGFNIPGVTLVRKQDSLVVK